MKNKPYIILIASLLSPVFSFSQQNTVPQKESTVLHEKIVPDSEIKRKEAHGLSVNSNAFSPLLSTVSFVNLTSTLGEKDITGTVALRIRTNSIFNLTINTPFDNSRTEAINLSDEFAGSTTVGIGYQQDLWKFSNVCYKETDMVNAFEKINEKRKKRNTEEKDTAKRVETAVHKYTDLTDDEKKIFLNTFKYRINLPFFGVGYKLSRKGFDYFNDTLFKMYTQNDLFYANEIRVFGGIKRSVKTSFGISCIIKYYYDAGDATTYDVPTQNPAVLQQLTLYPSAPELKNKVLIQLECRHLFNEGALAINPSINFDAVNQVAGLRVQLYFLTLKEDDKAKGLNGGLFAGYQTGKKMEMGNEKSNFLLGIFFSGLFDINKY
jgi:hypothetical protein